MTAFEEKYLNMAKEIVLAHIPKEEYAVFLFGSRAEGTSKEFSDIDVGIWNEKKTDSGIRFELMELLAESKVPYDVEIVNFNTVRDKFRTEALKKIEVWNLPKSLSTKFNNFVKQSLD